MLEAYSEPPPELLPKPPQSGRRRGAPAPTDPVPQGHLEPQPELLLEPPASGRRRGAPDPTGPVAVVAAAANGRKCLATSLSERTHATVCLPASGPPRLVHAHAPNGPLVAAAAAANECLVCSV